MKIKKHLKFQIFRGLVVLILCLPACGTNENKDSLQNSSTEEITIPCLVAKNVEVKSDELLSGIVQYATIRNVVFSEGGKLEYGDAPIAVGKKFKFNELLFKINLETAFLELNVQKSIYSQKLANLQKAIDTDIPSESAKWKEFSASITPSKRLPDFPAARIEAERKILNSEGIYTTYFELKVLEKRIENYFYFAPFDGQVIALFQSQNAVVKKKQSIAKIAKLNDFNIIFTLPLEVFKSINSSDKIDFLSSNEVKIAKGNVINSKIVGSDVDVTFSCIPLKRNGVKSNQTLYLKSAAATKKGIYLPVSAVKNNEVKIWKANKKSSFKVQVGFQKDSLLFVTNIPDGCIVLLN